MRRLWGVIVLTACFAASATAAGKGPEIQLIDNKLSMHAESVALGRLLRLLDQATGMTSKVPSELANRNVSVRFSGLNFDDAVKKIFEGQSLDYVVIGGQGIIVTAVSQRRRDQPGPSPSPFPVTPSFPQLPEQPFVEEVPQPGGAVPGQFPPAAVPNNPFNQPQTQPAVIQTPFGPIPNPRANQQLQPNTPFSVPGQQNPVPNQQPFGAMNPFATPQQNPNNLFGNTAPQMMNTAPGATPPGTQQQRRP